MKATDLQAAIGCAQMDKLEGFVSQRRRNWSILRRELDELSDVLLLPEETPGSHPSWFGFLITVKESAPFSRNALVQYLESRNIQTRNLFAGNFLRHPCFDELREEQGVYRIAGELTNTDDAMERAFWIGVYPGMTDEKLHYMANAIKTFVRERGPAS